MPVLHADMAVECWVGEHLYAAVFAATLLVVVALIIPTQLLRTVRRARQQRDASLLLRADQVDTWFDELDANHSISLEGDEITELHKRMEQLDNVITTLDPDGDGTVTRQEFTDWYRGQLTTIVNTPLDVLYGTTQSDAYWWPCYFLLWLKTVINVLYIYGSAHQMDWHIWMFMAVVVSMVLMIYCEPYVAKVDQHMALVSLLSLAGVAYISSICKSGTSWDPMYIILATLLFFLPIVAYISSKFGHLRSLYSRAHDMAEYADIHSRGVDRSKRQAVSPSRVAPGDEAVLLATPPTTTEEGPTHTPAQSVATEDTAGRGSICCKRRKKGTVVRQLAEVNSDATDTVIDSGGGDGGGHAADINDPPLPPQLPIDEPIDDAALQEEVEAAEMVSLYMAEG
jgi:hypothetical protein